VKSITKNGYAISNVEAFDAPKILMLEKIKKLASNAKRRERTTKAQVLGGILNIAGTTDRSKIKNGSSTITLLRLLIKRSRRGGASYRIL
jgi:hypothetical protein